MRKSLIFLIIFLLAVALFKLGSVPRGFDGDEAAVGYYAASLLRWGTDEFGNRWPIYFKSIGDYKYPGYPYFSILPVAIGGLSVFTTRFLSALAGVTTIAAIYWYLAGKTKGLATLLYALVAAGAAWFLVFSRAAREANLGLALETIGFLLIIKGRTNKGELIIGGILMFLAAMTYPAYRLFGAILLIGWGSARRSFSLLLLAAFLLLLSLDPKSRIRASGLLFTTDPEIAVAQQTQIWEVGLAWPGKAGLVLARVFDNRYTHFAINFINRYLLHFDPVYLFIKGNPNLPWYAVPGSGLMPLIALPLILIGIWVGLKKFREDSKYPLAFWWLLTAPISSSITVETPNPVRHLLAWPAYLMFIYWGIEWLTDLKIKRAILIKALATFLVAINLIYSWKQFFIHREYHRPWYNDQGRREVVEYALANLNNYEQVVVPGDPYIFFLFWGKDFSYKDLTVNESQWNSVTQIAGKITFNMPLDCPKVGREKVLYLCKGTEVPQNSTVKKVVYFNDGLPAFAAIEFHKLPKMAASLPELPNRLTYMVDTNMAEADKRNGGVIPKEENRLW